MNGALNNYERICQGESKKGLMSGTIVPHKECVEVDQGARLWVSSVLWEAES